MSKEIEAFKRGFSDCCCDRGLSQEAAASLVASAVSEKIAGIPLSTIGGYLSRLAVPAAAAAGYGAATLSRAPAVAAQGLQGYGNFLLPLAATVGGGLGLAGGGIAGKLLAKATDDTPDPDAVKAKELADAYRAMADSAHTSKRIREYRNR